MSCGSCGKSKTISRTREEPTEDVHGETGCECVFQEGDTEVFCPRHNVTKSMHQYKLCKHRRDYFQKWEEGRGAGQTPTSNAEVQAGVVETPEEKEEGKKRRMQIEKSQEIPQKSRGLGDTIEKITKATGIKSIVEAFTKVTGKDCNCDGRREWLNKKAPYRHKTKGFFE